MNLYNKQYQLFIKRLFDIIFSLAVLITSMPILILIAIMIKILSKGSILYKSERVGVNGKIFIMYKFRTMVMNSDKQGALTKANDNRVYWFGKFLRKAKLDEFPQLCNILMGDMSIVGPRPESPELVKKYYRRQDLTTLQVKPGLASPGTLYFYMYSNFHLVTVDYEKYYGENLLPLKLGMDQIYIKKMSLIYDLQLIVRTAILILQKLLGKDNFSMIKEFNLALQQHLFW